MIRRTAVAIVLVLSGAFMLLAQPAMAQSEPQPPATTPAETPSSGTDGDGATGGGEVGMAPDSRDSSRILASTGSEILQLTAIGFLLVGFGVGMNQVRRERLKVRDLRGS